MQADEFRDKVTVVFNRMLENGWQPDDAVEALNKTMFSVSMDREVDGWPVLRIVEDGKLELNVEGWSRGKEHE